MTSQGQQPVSKVNTEHTVSVRTTAESSSRNLLSDRFKIRQDCTLSIPVIFKTKMNHLNQKARGEFNVAENDVLSSRTSRYRIEGFLGEGSYGIVAKCADLDTKRKVAIKMVRRDYAWTGDQEASALKKVRELQKKNNIVEFIENFQHRGHHCLAFEMLDMSLHDLMVKRRLKPLNLSEIRVIGQQMLVALKALKSLGVAHADIKPDNIMLVNHEAQPFKVKLIDFGLAAQVSRFHRGRRIQALCYRAPEVILGVKIDEGIDMWALGCVLAFLYLGWNLYPQTNEYEAMEFIVRVNGTPGNHLLNSGLKTNNFFTRLKRNVWRMNTRDEYKSMTGIQTKSCFNKFSHLESLEDIVMSNTRPVDIIGHKDRRSFLSLLKYMLHVDPGKRITPTEALGHRFITMKYFQGPYRNDYITDAHATLERCQVELPSEEIKSYKTCSDVLRATLMPAINFEDPSAVRPDVKTKKKRKAKTAGKKQRKTQGEENNRTAAGKTACPNTKKKRKDGDRNQKETSNKAAKGKTETKKLLEEESFVEVKTKKKWYERIGHFFHRVFGGLGCCRTDTVLT